MEKNNYRVVENKRETHDVVTLYIEREDGRPVAYVPGQFITVYFPETGTPEGKSYSLASAPHERTVRITVKAMGGFSNRLSALLPGETFLGSQPYGFFFSESSVSDMVLLAGGIGIAPFRSMILDATLSHPTKKIILNYSNRTMNDVIFKAELDRMERENRQIKVNHFITREGARMRMDPKSILQALPDLIAPEFFLCGSIEFVRDMWRGLKENGVPEEMIYTEAFFSH